MAFADVNQTHWKCFFFQKIEKIDFYQLEQDFLSMTQNKAVKTTDVTGCCASVLLNFPDALKVITEALITACFPLNLILGM